MIDQLSKLNLDIKYLDELMHLQKLNIDRQFYMDLQHTLRGPLSLRLILKKVQ